MDYPFRRKVHYNLWPFLPKDAPIENKTANNYLFNLIKNIPQKEKFNYLAIIIFVIVLLRRIQFSPHIWVWLVIALIIVFYLNERDQHNRNTISHQLWATLNGPYLRNTRYFINAPELIRWVENISELKRLNRVQFNQMVKSIDNFNMIISHIETGVTSCREALDILKDLKTTICNQFHTFIYRINNATLRNKYNFYLSQLGDILNVELDKVIKLCRHYYIVKPVTTESGFDSYQIGDPKPNDSLHDKNYNYYI